MFAASTYEEVVEHERRIENMEIVVQRSEKSCSLLDGKTIRSRRNE